MTQEAEIKKLKSELTKLKKIVKAQSEEKTAAETIAEVLKEQEAKPRRRKWGERELVAFSKNRESYVTPKQKKIKELIDSLVESHALSTVASEVAINTFLANPEIQQLDRAGKFWAKHYYKQNWLVYPKQQRRQVGPIDE